MIAPARAGPTVHGVPASATSSSIWRQTNESVRVAPQRPGQEARLAEHLEAVADAHHPAAGLGVPAHRGHDRRAAGDGAAAQVVAVREAAGQQHGGRCRRAARRRRARPRTVRAAEALDRARAALSWSSEPGKRTTRPSGSPGDLHRVVLDQRRWRAAARTSRAAWPAGSSPSISSSMRLPMRTSPTPSKPSCAQGAGDGLPLGVEDALLGHHGHDHAAHVGTPGSSRRCRGRDALGAPRCSGPGCPRRPRRAARAAARRGPSRSRRASRAGTACRTTGGLVPRRPAVGGPQARRVGRHGLVAQHQPPGVVGAQLELGVGQDDPGARAALGGARGRGRA